jgi:hypothetical protein
MHRVIHKTVENLERGGDGTAFDVMEAMGRLSLRISG